MAMMGWSWVDGVWASGSWRVYVWVGSSTFDVAMNVTSVGTSTTSQSVSYKVAMSFTGVGTGSLDRTVAFLRSMSLNNLATLNVNRDLVKQPVTATAVGVADSSDGALWTQQGLGTATAVGTATLASIAAFPRALSATGIGTSAFVTTAISKILSVTGVADVSDPVRDTIKDGGNNNATAVAALTLSRAITRAVSLGVNFTGTATLEQHVVPPSPLMIGHTFGLVRRRLMFSPVIAAPGRRADIIYANP